MVTTRKREEVAWANRQAAEDTIGPDLSSAQIAASKYAVTERWSEKHPRARHAPPADWPNMAFKVSPLIKARLDKVSEVTGVPVYKVAYELIERGLADETKLAKTIDVIAESARLSAKAWAASTLERWRQKLEAARAYTRALEKHVMGATPGSADWYILKKDFELKWKPGPIAGLKKKESQ